MRLSSSLLAFVAVAVVALGASLVDAATNFPVNVSGTLTKEGPLLASNWSRVNLQGALSVTVERGAFALVLCLQRLVPAPDYRSLSAASCTFLVHLAANETTATVAGVTDEALYWTLFFDVASGAPPASEVPVRVLLQGSSCESGQAWDGTDCIDPTPFGLASDNLTLSLAPNTPAYALLDLPAMTGSFELSASDAKVELTVRLFGTPSDALNDAQGTGTVSVALPRPGSWFVRASLKAGGVAENVTLTVHMDKCHAASAQGVNCSTNVTEGSTLAMSPVKLAPGGVAYFLVNSSVLWVSAFAPDSEVQPTLSLTRGQLPTLTGADVGACNRAACELPSIQVPSSSGSLWFAAVRMPSVVGNASNASVAVGVWFGSLCAQGCETHGTCNTAGVEGYLGQCECVSDYQGVDCMTPSGAMLGAQYIVLIIIASLVVASALIGFVAWAYMRRRRVAYDKEPILVANFVD